MLMGVCVQGYVCMLESGTEARQELKHHPECVCLVAAFCRHEVYSWCADVGCVMWGVSCGVHVRTFCTQ